MPDRPALAIALAAALAAAACRAAPEPPRPGERSAVGVMTTLPLIWGEAADIGELLDAKARDSWVLQELDRRFTLEPLDTLDESSLAALDQLVLAQPRALSPAENVALDAWVRGGGRLLLFADPMLTRHSRYAIGDRRRPQDVALLSPILAHWGLELLFDEDQGPGERTHEIMGTAVPVNMAGRFYVVGESPCSPAPGAVLVRCRIGKGRVVALADAAVLDDAEPGTLSPRREALGHLVRLAFD